MSHPYDYHCGCAACDEVEAREELDDVVDALLAELRATQPEKHA